MIPEKAQVIVIALNSQGVAYQSMTGEAFLEFKQEWDDEPYKGHILGMPYSPPRKDFHMGVYNVEDMSGRLYDTSNNPEPTPLYDQTRKDHGPWSD